MDNEMIRHKFRTSAFGGFKRKDVAAYIESASLLHDQQLKQLQEQNQSLSAKNDELSGMLLEMEQRLKAARASLDSALSEKDELAAMLEQLTLQTQSDEPLPEGSAEPVESAEVAVHSQPVCVPVIKSPKTSVKTLLDSIRKPEPETVITEAADTGVESDQVPEITVETPDGKELLASIKIYYPR